MALTAKGIENGMTKVEKLGMDTSNMSIHILSHEPQIKTASVLANEAVHIPINQSIENITQSEQLIAQQNQEQQMAQNQSQYRGINLT